MMEGYIMFLRIGLLCSALVAAAIVAGETPEFKPHPDLTETSLKIIKHLRKIHPKLADHCNESSKQKSEDACGQMLRTLYTKKENGENNAAAKTINAYNFTDQLFNKLGITKERYQKSCAIHKDPIDFMVCMEKQAETVLAYKGELIKAIDNDDFSK
jgi:hypothetical protein